MHRILDIFFYLEYCILDMIMLLLWSLADDVEMLDRRLLKSVNLPTIPRSIRNIDSELYSWDFHFKTFLFQSL